MLEQNDLLNESYERTYNDYVEAYVSYQILKEQNRNPAHHSALNKYPSFFNYMRTVNVFMIEICLYRVFDTKEKSHGIRNLLNIIKDIDVSIHEKISDFYLRECKPLSKKIRFLRGNSSGHTSLKYSRWETYNNPSYKLNDQNLEKIMVNLKEFFSLIRQNFPDLLIVILGNKIEEDYKEILSRLNS